MADFISKDKRELIQQFRDYQISCLTTAHGYIQLEPEIEKLVVDFIQETASCFVLDGDSDDSD